jgi:predicted PurR-regulated permease PerM
MKLKFFVPKNEEKNLIFIPFYAKSTFVLLGLLATIVLLFIGQRIILPIIYAIIIAIVLSPVVDLLTNKKLNRNFAISITVALFLIIFGLIISFICIQMIQFSESFPQLVEKFHLTTESIAAWVSDSFGLTHFEIYNWIDNKNKEILSQGGAVFAAIILSTGNGLVLIIIVLVYIFMILFYQMHLLEFVHRLFNTNQSDEVDEVLGVTKKIIQTYLTGLIFEAIVVATLNVTALWLLGIKYALLLGVIGAIINVIPIVGGIISMALPMLMAFATKDSAYVMYVFIAYFIIQFFDVHYFIPKVVASKVKINAFVSVIAVFAGGALWGYPGMFLSIPLLAILKVVFDHIDPLKPWGFLIGNGSIKKPLVSINTN